MNKFDIQPERATPEAIDAYTRRPLWRLEIRGQAPAAIQPALFAFSAPPATEAAAIEIVCDHIGAGRETQLRLDGGTSQLCSRCNAVVESEAPK